MVGAIGGATEDVMFPALDMELHIVNIYVLSYIGYLLVDVQLQSVYINYSTECTMYETKLSTVFHFNRGCLVPYTGH